MTSSIVHDKHTRPEHVVVHMENVDSRSIRRLGYNPDTEELVIQFHDSLPGLRTVYSGVPQEVVDGLLNAEVKAQYLEENIRYLYDFALIDEDGLIDPEKTRQRKNGEI